MARGNRATRANAVALEKKKGGRGTKRKMKIEERGCVVHSLVCDFLGKREGDRRRGEMPLWLQESQFLFGTGVQFLGREHLALKLLSKKRIMNPFKI